MIRSKWKFLGKQKIFIQLFFFAIATILLADEIARSFFEYGILYKFQKGPHSGWSLAFFIPVFILWLYNIVTIVRFINILSIDVSNKTISFKNILTGKATTYSFADFDGYCSTSRTAAGYRYNELFLMINNRSVRKISEYYYSNFEALAEGISSLHYIGPFKYSFQNDVRMFFNMSF